MTSESKIASEVVNTNAQARRNKDTDIYGNRYDSRSGYWGLYDKAVILFQEDLSAWVDLEHCILELELINRNKPGRPFEYPPSTILFLTMQKEAKDQSYREIVGDMKATLSALNLPMPSYKTIQRNKDRFFGPGGKGMEVMMEAERLLGGRRGDFDPTMFLDSGICPDYSAPQKIPVCEADVLEQAEKDAEAAEIRRSMAVKVNKEYIGKEAECALDGSGVGTKGSGIYIELVWSLNKRNFIKQHVLLDVRTQKVVSFSITPEAPGDARVMPAIVRGTLKMGVCLVRLMADGAYDTVANWMLIEEVDLDFNPNLKDKFKDDKDLVTRHALRMIEEALGKERHHRISGYNMRWLVESFFSVIKKLYGERVKDRLFRMMAISMTIRYTLYNIRRGYILRFVDEHCELDERLEVVNRQEVMADL